MSLLTKDFCSELRCTIKTTKSIRGRLSAFSNGNGRLRAKRTITFTLFSRRTMASANFF
uniref:Uncharacterized protein n=1 Tax=Anguilla anguilla TaxID=7936 RepID=A0A0E9UUV2_ANGAN